MLSPIKIPRNNRTGGQLQEISSLPAKFSKFLLVPILLVALLLSYMTWDMQRPPQNISEAHLAGHRSPTPISLIVLLDESGSFQSYGHIRELALKDVLGWSTSNLRPDDSITVISFSGSADTKMSTATVGEISAGKANVITPTVSGGTSIQPALELARTTTPTNMPQSLIVVTDTQIDDAHPAAIGAAVRALNVLSMSLIVPDAESVTPDWSDAFPYEHVIKASADSADQSALAIAEAAAHATGQVLEKN